jgi:hypothetical protein
VAAVIFVAAVAFAPELLVAVGCAINTGNCP